MMWDYKTVKPGPTNAATRKRAADSGYSVYADDHRGTHMRKPTEAAAPKAETTGTTKAAPKRKTTRKTKGGNE